MVLVVKPILSHEAILFWSENPTRKQLTAAILLLVCNDMRFFRFAHFSHGKIKVSVRSLNIYHVTDRSMLLSRFNTRFIYQCGISGCKLHMRTGSQTGLQCQEVEFLAHVLSTLVFVFVSRAVGAKLDFEIRLFKLEMTSK